MDAEYSAYLLSDQWRAKRDARLAINSGTCSACSKTKGIHVHHLTYARIFNEDMADLLPLCEEHHQQIEAIIKEGRLPRKGNVLFLASETIRLLLSRNDPVRVPVGKSIPRPRKVIKKTKEAFNCDWPKPARNSIQAELLNDRKFMLAMTTMNRVCFKAWCRSQEGWNNKYQSNAFVLYDSHKPKKVRPDFYTRNTARTNARKLNGQL